MNIDDIIDSERSESRELDYKHPGAEIADLVKELVAVANSGGGSVIVGVEEDGGEIVDVHNVPNPSETEEGIQQHIREKVDPDLSVSHSVDQYTGDNNDYHGRNLLILTAEPGQTLYSYEESRSSIVFPYRLGSTTDYLTGSKVYRFYQANVWPGRAGEVTDEGNQGRNSLQDVMADVATAISDAGNNGEGESRSDESTSTEQLPDLELHQSEVPYHFTPAGGLETITFHQVPYYPQAYSIEGNGIHIEKDEIESVFAALKEYFGAEIESGHFTITQRNAAWFGQGAGDFLAALNIDERYGTVPDSFTIDKHHSEGTIFIADSQFGTIVVRSRRGINLSRDYLDQFSISFCTDGIPVDTRSLEQFLNVLDYETQHARPFEMEPEQFHFGHRNIEIESLELLQSRHDDDFAGWAICQNPFYEQPELLIDNLESDRSDFETLTKYERIPCRIKDHHPIDERHDYELLRASVTPLTPVQGSVPHANAMVWINW